MKPRTTKRDGVREAWLAPWTALVTALAQQGPRRRYTARTSGRDWLASTRSQSQALRAALRSRPGPASSRPRPGRRRGVNCAEAQFNITGDCHQVAPVARRARLVSPPRPRRVAPLRRPFGLMAIPVMSCAPRRLRARSAGSRGVARSPRAECIKQCGSGKPQPQAHGQRACGASTTNTMPTHPGPRSARSGSPSSPPRCARPSPSARVARPLASPRAAAPRSGNSRRLRGKPTLARARACCRMCL